MARAPKPAPDAGATGTENAATGGATDAGTPAADAGAVQAGAGGNAQPPKVAAPPAPATPAAPGFRLRVRALQPSRWRIGRQFGSEPVEIAAEMLSEAQIMALMQDTLLAVEVIAPDRPHQRRGSSDGRAPGS